MSFSKLKREITFGIYHKLNGEEKHNEESTQTCKTIQRLLSSQSVLDPRNKYGPDLSDWDWDDDDVDANGIKSTYTVKHLVDDSSNLVPTS